MVAKSPNSKLLEINRVSNFSKASSDEYDLFKANNKDSSTRTGSTYTAEVDEIGQDLSPISRGAKCCDFN